MLPPIAIVHDYLTQRGGAERVALLLARAFPAAPLYTSLYEPSTTFPEFEDVDVRPSPLNRVAPLRRNHRAALPLLASTFSNMRVSADVVFCSSSGWAHGARVNGTKIVYCHTPARWLYQTDRYVRGRSVATRAAATAYRRPLVRWDKRAAATADYYLANSTVVAARIAEAYGIEAEVLPPPPAVTPDGPLEPVDGLEPGYALCVSRLLPYKNVDAIIGAFAELRDERLVIAGTGPELNRLRPLAPANVTLLGHVPDSQLRWLYQQSSMLVSGSHEDFGLTPLEAATFGKPSVVLRWGGFTDTVLEGETGMFFELPTATGVAGAVREARSQQWQSHAITSHAQRFAESRFIERIRSVVVHSA
jgi:glycosyltransferase involved in cell wall biosynthesis